MPYMTYDEYASWARSRYPENPQRAEEVIDKAQALGLLTERCSAPPDSCPITVRSNPDGSTVITVEK